MKEKKLGDRISFESASPEVNLPSNLDVDVNIEDFPPLGDDIVPPLKENGFDKTQAWVDIASASCRETETNIKNDRCILEH